MTERERKERTEEEDGGESRDMDDNRKKDETSRDKLQNRAKEAEWGKSEKGGSLTEGKERVLFF